MIRLALLSVFCTAIAIYAVRDWYRALCGLILMMAVLEHPDMPRTVAGIQGLNPWNIVFTIIAICWLSSRHREGLKWDMPAGMNFLLVAYFAVIIVGWVRMVVDSSHMYGITHGDMVSEFLINTLKWTLPGVLLFDGCRSRERFRWALFSIVGVYFILALQVIRWMPPSYAIQGDSLAARSSKILKNEVGFHRVTVSMMLAGASWAVFSMRLLANNNKQRIWYFLAFVAMVYAQALTAGRAGYATWAVVGLIMCLIKWPKYLLLIPVVVLVITLAVPGAVERALEGTTHETQQVDPTAGADPNANRLYTILAGRNIAWRHVLPMIGESAVVGYGRNAMVRTGLAQFLMETLNESFPHPHNAYLELLLDNGVIGFVVIMPFYFVVLRKAIRLFRERDDPMVQATGGVCCALVLALMVASFGSQSFYPVESTMVMWCAVFLMLRVDVERRKQANDFDTGDFFLGKATVAKKSKKLMYWGEEAERVAPLKAVEAPMDEESVTPAKDDKVMDLWRS